MAYVGLILEIFTYSSNLELLFKALLLVRSHFKHLAILHGFPSGWRENSLQLKQCTDTKFTLFFGPWQRWPGTFGFVGPALWKTQRTQHSLTWYCKEMLHSGNMNCVLQCKATHFPQLSPLAVANTAGTHQNVLEIKESHPSSLKSMAKLLSISLAQSWTFNEK